MPAGLLPGGSDAVSRSFRRRVANETPWRMRQHPTGRRHALYALFLAHREREITDGLVNLLIETVHRITSQARPFSRSSPAIRNGRRLMKRSDAPMAPSMLRRSSTTARTLAKSATTPTMASASRKTM